MFARVGFQSALLFQYVMSGMLRAFEISSFPRAFLSYATRSLRFGACPPEMWRSARPALAKRGLRYLVDL